jgi:hypothetical protein
MPRFTGQNKKRIDPRYFLNERVEEGILDFFKSDTEKRRADAEMFFNAQPGTLRFLILNWISSALPDTDIEKYHSRDDITTGSDFAKAEAQRYISEYLPGSPIEEVVESPGDIESEDWNKVGLDPTSYDAHLSFDTLIQTIKSMYEDSRMDILHNDPMKLMGRIYPGGIIHYSLLYLGKGLISSRKRYERKKQ